MKSRRSFDDHFKAKVSLEAIKGEKTISELASAYGIHPNQTRRLMKVLGVEALYPRPKVSASHPEHRIFPYLLRGVCISGVNHVCSGDITLYSD